MSSENNEELWYSFLSEGKPRLMEQSKALFRALPADPRCIFCHSPFEGFGGRLTKLIGRSQSREDPRFCNACIKIGHEHPGGAYVDVAMVFADVRGSTPLAEEIGDREFSRLIQRFFRVSAQALIHANGLIDRLAGDAAIGFFVYGLAGPEYPLRALESAQQILRATGHGQPEGAWIPVGVGVHFGNAYVGLVASDAGVGNFTALGDDINVGARIGSAAEAGELLASPELLRRAGVDHSGFEHREVSLKGKQEPMDVVVVPVS